MYLAPLNYDRFFKKVFSEKWIAQRFLEDFFDIEIEEIEMLATKHKITDNASAVEFDFRCKINGSYIIIDMQQWFKTDIIKRFYLYHSMNTVLQLEKMPDKSIAVEEEKKREVKDYDVLLPVITLIWLADDSLGFDEDFVSYMMTSEVVHDFLENKTLWREDNIVALLKERERCLQIMNNKTKKLDFLKQNRLIYAFQPNIVRNKKLSKYLRWFEFAAKSRSRKNEKEWFDEYLNDDVFVEIMIRINTEEFEAEDWKYIDDFDKYNEQVQRYENVFRKEGYEIGFSKGEEIGFSKGEEKQKLLIAKMMKAQGEPIEKIILYTNLSKEAIEKA
jgi:hypothetical protein